jgi:di/tricarboxylate transporter
VTLEIALVLGILAGAVLLFVSEWVRVDLVALIVLVSLVFSGLLTPIQAVSGFSNPAVITVWAVFILSGALARTGVAGILGRQILRLSGDSESRLIMIIMLTSASLSAFMNNVGVAALLLPVVMDIARRTRRSPSKLLIPLAFSSLLGGLTTLIGTPPNILVSAALEQGGLAPFRFFDFTPVGAAVVLAGIAYMAFVGRRILPTRIPVREMAGEKVDLDQTYGIKAGLLVLDVPTGSPLIGKSLADSRLGSALGLNVMGVKRGGRVELAPDPSHRFEAEDRIIAQGPRDASQQLGVTEYLVVAQERVAPEELITGDYDFAELTLSPKSGLIGRTIRDIDFRKRFHGVLVIAAWRDETPIRTHLAETALEADDVLLALGHREELEKLRHSAELVYSGAADLGRYRLEERLMSLTVPAASPLVGESLEHSRLGDVFSLGVMAIFRDGLPRLLPPREETLQAGDVLLVKCKREDLITVTGLHGLRIDKTAAPGLGDLESERVCLGELVLAPRSTVVGKTLSQLHFREKYGMNVVAVMRQGKVYDNLRYFPLAFGDALLVHGPREKLQLIASEPDFIVLSEDTQKAPLTGKAPIAALVMAGVVGSVILGLIPIYIAAVAGAILVVLTGCLSMDEAYRSIEWRAVFLIAGMLPLGLAMQETGAAEWVAAGVVGAVGGLGPLAVVAGLYLLTAVAAQVMPTSAVAILVAPLAITAATDLGMSPYALMMTVSLSASASFMSPVAHPANVLIMGPGGYRFVDYIKVGLPLTLVCLLVTLLLLPLVWPLTP